MMSHFVFYSNIINYLTKRLKGLIFQFLKLIFSPICRTRISLFTLLFISINSILKMCQGAKIESGGKIEIREGAYFFMDKRSVISRNSEIIVGKESKLIIGEATSIGSYSNIRCDGQINIGKNVLIAQYCSFISGQYLYEDKNWESISTQGFKNEFINIHDNVWIGTHVVILPGVNIGQGAIIGAGSIVTKDVPEFSIACGNPAKVIKIRK